MRFLDLRALADAPLTTDPFAFTVVRNFIRPWEAGGLRRDFPAIPYPGLLPVDATRFGPGFGALIEEVRGPEVARAFGEKFDIELSGRPMMVTVRGRCDVRDGRIHTDSKTKCITVLLYFNDTWAEQGGRLRLLRGPDDLNDMIAEVPPDFGTLIAFRRSDRSFHGHEPFVGLRRYIMFNWMASGFSAWREITRHKVSALVKRHFSPAAKEPAHV